jgi:D-amino-acid dehydrogenase
MRDPGVLVIGGGVVGLFCAYHLRRGGADVIVVERGTVGDPEACSSGNTGFVGTHGVEPLRQVSVTPCRDFETVRWLWHFRHVRGDSASFGALLEMKRRSLAILRSLRPDGFTEAGMIIGFRSQQAFAQARRSMPDTVARGVPLRVLEPDELRELEPDTEFDLAGAAYNEEGAFVRVPAFLTELAGRLEEMGVAIHSRTEVTGFETAGGEVTRVLTTQGDYRPAEVVLAAGVWTEALARRLGIALRLQPLKGYAVTVKAPAGAPRRPVTLAEARIAVTPLGDRLRFGGVRQLAGMDRTASRTQVDGMLRAVRSYLPRLDLADSIEVWTGLRPCTPDSRPCIGRSASYRNLSIAAGHGHIGMGLAPAGGELLAQLVAGEPALLDPAPFRTSRWERHAS